MDRPQDNPTPPFQVACVSFLNSKPLVEPLLDRADVHVHFAVPSRLSAMIDTGIAQCGLLSIVDYQLSKRPMALVPAGMIGCDGPTLTVRIFSRVPAHDIHILHGDTDSHTSVILAQVILRELYRTTPTLMPLNANTIHDPRSATHDAPESILLIGDKVVTNAPPQDLYPYQLDLGEEWKKLTGLPFVFAMWMMPADNTSAPLATLLQTAQRRGRDMTDELLTRHATEHGWPHDLARRYFTEYLRYAVTDQAKKGLAEFFTRAHRLGLLNATRPIHYLELPPT